MWGRAVWIGVVCDKISKGLAGRMFSGRDWWDLIRLRDELVGD